MLPCLDLSRPYAIGRFAQIPGACHWPTKTSAYWRDGLHGLRLDSGRRGRLNLRREERLERLENTDVRLTHRVAIRDFHEVQVEKFSV